MIENVRQTIGESYGSQHEQITNLIFTGAKLSIDDLASGVINRAEQIHLRGAAFQPIMWRSVGLQHHALSALTLALHTLDYGTSNSWWANVVRNKQSRKRGARKLQTFVARQQLSEVRDIEIMISTRGSSQLAELLDDS